MILDDPAIYFGNGFLDFDVENENGLRIGFTEDEIERIEIVEANER